MQDIKVLFETIEQLFRSCDIDYQALQQEKITKEWFEVYENQRIVNSFLFNYIKIQDKIGAKLFRSFLYSLREIVEDNMSMIDMLHRLEQLEIIESIDEWDQLREIRNVIAHEYPLDIEERLENIHLALGGFKKLHALFAAIKKQTLSKGIG